MAQQPVTDRSPHLPHVPIDRLRGILGRFLRIEAASGIILLFATLAALVLANSSLSESYLRFWETEIGIRIGSFELVHSLKHWINDGLMTLFFFVIGLEVKREIVSGELRNPRTASLPVVAALGGMIAPAAFYLALQYGQPGERGWGIPMATDIAFVVGCLALLGSRVPRGLRVLLLSLAIADDIGAILVIAIGYSSDLNFHALSIGCAGMVIVVVMAQLGVRSVPIYFLVGVVIWHFFHESGIHPTIAGVILGLLTPARNWVGEERLNAIIGELSVALKSSDEEKSPDRGLLQSVELAARESISPLGRLESAFHPWVGFVIMPIFALANAGIPLHGADFSEPISVAVMVGLVLGKPIGIVLFTWLAVSLGIARLPRGVTWAILLAGGILAGIGFTMALFIAGLALEGDLLNASKVGILSASAFCAVVGSGLLYWLLSRNVRSNKSDDSSEPTSEPNERMEASTDAESV